VSDFILCTGEAGAGAGAAVSRQCGLDRALAIHRAVSPRCCCIFVGVEAELECAAKVPLHGGSLWFAPSSPSRAVRRIADLSNGGCAEMRAHDLRQLDRIREKITLTAPVRSMQADDNVVVLGTGEAVFGAFEIAGRGALSSHVDVVDAVYSTVAHRPFSRLPTSYVW
jgi:hypothetical protein